MPSAMRFMILRVYLRRRNILRVAHTARLANFFVLRMVFLTVLVIRRVMERFPPACEQAHCPPLVRLISIG